MPLLTVSLDMIWTPLIVRFMLYNFLHVILATVIKPSEFRRSVTNGSLTNLFSTNINFMFPKLLVSHNMLL